MYFELVDDSIPFTNPLIGTLEFSFKFSSNIIPSKLPFISLNISDVFCVISSGKLTDGFTFSVAGSFILKPLEPCSTFKISNISTGVKSSTSFPSGALTTLSSLVTC